MSNTPSVYDFSAEDDGTRIETWLHVGTIQQDNLRNTDAAAATYRAILERDPGQVDASMRLEAIYEGHEQWRELAALLLQRNLNIRSSSWSICDAAGRSELGFYPVYVGQNTFMLIIGGTPYLQGEDFVLLVKALIRRYA